MSSAVASGLTPKTSCHAVLVPLGASRCASGAADPELACPGDRFGQTALTIMYPRMKKTIAANASKLPIGDAHGQVALQRRQRLERRRRFLGFLKRFLDVAQELHARRGTSRL